MIASTLVSLLLAFLPQEAAPVARPQKNRAPIPTEKTAVQRGRKFPVHVELARASTDPSTPLIVLFHGSKSSLGEYRPIVPHLKVLGYNCLSVDLCSGYDCNEVRNWTATYANSRGVNPTYLTALDDLQDTLLWARAEHAHGKLIAWGSGYSASLVIHAAANHPDLVDGVLAFSPGEYFTVLGKSETWIQESAKLVESPVFVTSSRSDQGTWQPIFDALASKSKTGFVPAVEGEPGSRALWQKSEGRDECWTAVEAFLAANFPVEHPVAPAEEAPK